MAFLLSFIACIILSSSLDFLIVYDNDSNFNITKIEIDLYQKLASNKKISVLWTKKELSYQVIENSTKQLSIFDLTSKSQSHYELSLIANSYNLAHFIFDDMKASYTPWTYSLTHEKRLYTQAVINVLDKFNWTKGVFFLNQENIYLEYTINSHFPNNLTFFITQSNSMISEIVNKEVLRLGSYLYFIFTNVEEAKDITKSLKQAKLLNYGSSVLMSHESSFNTNIDGSLIITDKGQEQAKSYEDYISTYIYNLIKILYSNPTFDESQYEIKQTMDQMCPNHYCSSVFSLLNVKNGTRILINDTSAGNFNKITFLGNNSLTIPSTQKKIIEVGMNSGTSNPNGTPPYTHNTIEFNGVFLGISLINEEKEEILPNYNLQGNEFDCGANAYNATFQMNCLKANINRIGQFFIPPNSTPVLLGFISNFKKLNVSKPIIGGRIGSSSVSSPTTYPLFGRVSFDATYLASMAAKMFYTLGWKTCALIYQTDSFTLDWVKSFNASANEHGVEIINNPNLRSFPANTFYDTLKSNYSAVFEEAINCNARLIIWAVFSNISPDGMKMLYDLGIRNGDLLIYYAIPGTISSIYAPETRNRDILIEISTPSIAFEQPTYIGNVGGMVADLLEERYGIDQNAQITTPCLLFDALILGGYSIDFMINRGHDYTNGTLLMSTMRKQRFQGCSGNVRIEDQTNNRVVEFAVLQNGYIDPTTGNITISNNAYFRPIGTTILQMLKPVLYPGNTTIFPGQYRVINGNCPFPDKLIRTFDKGRYLIFGICIALGITTGVITLYIWRKWWNIKVEGLEKEQEISVQDFIMAATIVIEFFQLLAMGPDMSSISSLLSDVGEAVSLDLDKIISVTQGIFWIFLDIIYFLVALWVILSSFVLLRIDEKFPDFQFFRILDWLANILMPIIGNLMFIPIISVLLDVFVCDKSIGDNFTDSYMIKDCYQFCWKGDHIIYATISLICLVVYEPLAVFCRPLWQELEHLVHVKYTPSYLMAKTVFQVILVLMNKTIKRAQDVAHGTLFTVVVFLFIIFSFWHKGYNYPRFSWWLSLSLIAVCYSSLLTTINIGTYNSSSPAWLIILAFGWALIGLIGILVQRKKYPSMLYRKKVKDTSTLFKFAFTFGRRSNKIRPVFNSSSKDDSTAK